MSTRNWENTAAPPKIRKIIAEVLAVSAKAAIIGKYFGRWAKVAGLVPVVAPMHERYNLLQSGVTEIDFHPITHMNAFKVQELAPNYIKIDAMVGAPWDLMFNLEKFNSLPEDVQQIMLETGKEAEIYLTDVLADQWREKILNEWEKQGVEFYELPADERAEWASRVDDIPAEWAAEMAAMGLPGWEIMHRFQDITEEMGYEWPRRWAVK